MALNTFERDTLAEIKARVMARKPVADWEKQMVLDLLKREQLAVDPRVIARAAADGFNVTGVAVL
jgi:hypothetical protein